MIDQDPSHHLRGDTIEVGAIPPDDPLLPYQSEVRLIDERSRLKGVVRALPAEIRGRQSSELLVNQRHQLLSRVAVAFAPREQEDADRAPFARAFAAAFHISVWRVRFVGSHDAADPILSR